MKTQLILLWSLLSLFLISPFAAQSQDVDYKFNEGIIRVDGEPWARMERRGGLTSGRIFILSTLSDERVAIAREIINREEEACWFRVYFPEFDKAIEYRSGATVVGRELAEGYVLSAVIESGRLNEKGVDFFCALYADNSRNYLLPFGDDYMLVRKKQ